MPWFLPNKQSENESERPRPLVLPQEIQRLPGRELLVRRGVLHLFKLDRVVSHRDPWFKHLAWSSDPERRPLGPPPPEVPQFAVAVEREDVATLTVRRCRAAVESESR